MLKHGVTGKQIKEFMDTMGKDVVGDLCVQIIHELSDACKAVGDKYLELEQKFPEIMSVAGFSVIATCNAVPIDNVDDPPICIVVGTQEGIQHAAQPLIKAFNNISQEAKHDKEIRG